METIAIINLRNIIDNLQYSNILLSTDDIEQYIAIPSERKKYYPTFKRGSSQKYVTSFGKDGFFNNGKTAIWSHWMLSPSTIKIAIDLPKDSENGWSEAWDFSKEDSVIKIERYMRLRAFW